MVHPEDGTRMAASVRRQEPEDDLAALDDLDAVRRVAVRQAAWSAPGTLSLLVVGGVLFGTSGDPLTLLVFVPAALCLGVVGLHLRAVRRIDAMKRRIRSRRRG